jgi:predicted secreted protein
MAGSENFYPASGQPTQAAKMALDSETSAVTEWEPQHLGTSYSATITQLTSLKEISFSKASELRKVQPKDIKRRISWESIIANPHNDIWLIKKGYYGQIIHPRVGDELQLSLNEIPSTGYIWVLVSTKAEVNLTSERFVEDVKDAYDVGGQREFKFILREPGSYDLVLSMQRTWLGFESQVDSFHLNLFVEQEHQGINPNFLLQDSV